MKGQSFINFLKEQDGKADRQKVLSLSALVGSSLLAQLMFIGTASAMHVSCPGQIGCLRVDISECIMMGCTATCPNGEGFPGSCYSA